jgi:hypothetical protein
MYYLDKGYEILYNYGDIEMKDDELLVEFIENILKIF